MILAVSRCTSWHLKSQDQRSLIFWKMILLFQNSIKMLPNSKILKFSMEPISSTSPTMKSRSKWFAPLMAMLHSFWSHMLTDKKFMPEKLKILCISTKILMKDLKLMCRQLTFSYQILKSTNILAPQQDKKLIFKLVTAFLSQHITTIKWLASPSWNQMFYSLKTLIWKHHSQECLIVIKLKKKWETVKYIQGIDLPVL